MYTVCWVDNEERSHWERCENRREVAALLIENRIENDEDVLIFTPDAEDFLITAEDIFAALG